MKALRVLVIEDDALIAMLLSELLAGMGHDVCATAATEADAVTAATRHRPDLMIVDARLGRSVCRAPARAAGRGPARSPPQAGPDDRRCAPGPGKRRFRRRGNTAGRT